MNDVGGDLPPVGLHGRQRSGIIYEFRVVRVWRNWQTRTVQVRMGFGP